VIARASNRKCRLLYSHRDAEPGARERSGGGDVRDAEHAGRSTVTSMTLAAIPLNEFIDQLEGSTPRKRDERKKR